MAQQEANLLSLVRDFSYWLQSSKGKERIEEREGRTRRYQERLQDEVAIDALSEDEVRKLLGDLWAMEFFKDKEARLNKILEANGLSKLKEWLKDLIRRGEEGLTEQDFNELLRSVKHIGSAILSELLCLRFPNRYWVWNNKTEMAAEELKKIGAWQHEPVGGAPGKQYFAWQPLQDKIREALRERKCGSNYFDADLFCYWLVGDRKVWRMAPGERGEWWDECRDNGCIVISWREAAERAENNDFSRLDRDELKALFEEVYKGGEGKGGWSQVWTFVHEIQPGDIIVAKRGAKEIVGIGIVTSDCIPPGHSDHPLGDNHELRHARKVDWRITGSVQVNFDLGKQTIVKEKHWDDIVAAYRKKGIDVYERLWPPDSSDRDSASLLVRYFAARGFHFTQEQVAAFYAALKTKGFVILSGLSGTGKTKLAQHFAELLCPKCFAKMQCPYCSKGKEKECTNPNCKKECTHLFLSVRPDWRDSKVLLGYYNPLTERYESTPLLEFLRRAAKDYLENKSNAQPYFVILDEMNLAHVEYYFADFLSVLESGRYTERDVTEQERDKIGWTKESLRLDKIGDLPLPPNLYIIGTVNIDETTYMFSPKVLDRAFTIEFREVDFSEYPKSEADKDATQIAEQIRQTILDDLSNKDKSNPSSKGKFYSVVADKEQIRKAIEALGDKKRELERLNKVLQPYDLHFGYRVLDEIALFVQNAKKGVPDVIGKLEDNEALDYAVLMKVLPKFHGPRQKLEKPLWQVLNWCLQSQLGNGKPNELPQKVWKQIADEEKPPSGDDIADQLEDWASVSKKFRYPNTAKKVLQMLRQLYEVGFASFAQ